MVKDTNPDHYKVDGANFIEYMNDPKIAGFGNWMFANGFNSGVWASTNWISVKDRLPGKNGDYLAYTCDGIVWPYFFTASSGVWEDTLGYSTDTVTHWMPLPEPPNQNSALSAEGR